MKEELRGPEVKGVSVAVVHEQSEDGAMVYNVYFINEREDILEQVLVSSKGYSIDEKTGEKTQTNMLRRLLGLILPKEYVKIEPIMEDVFGLTNEFLVSYWIRSEEHTSELQSRPHLVCRLLLEKKKKKTKQNKHQQ